MNNLNERLALMNPNKALILGILLAVIYYLTVFDDGSQTKIRLKNLKKQIKAAELQKSEINSLISQEKKLQERLELKEDYLSQIEKHIPFQIRNADLHRQIDEYAQAASIEVKNKKPLNKISGTYIDEIPLHFTADGDYSQITQFLSFISGSEKTILANDIILKINESKGNNKSITIEVTLNALTQSNEWLNETK